MQTIIQLSEAEEAKALPMLLRHAPGTMLPHRLYVVRDVAVQKLREAGMQCTALSRESNAPTLFLSTTQRRLLDDGRYDLACAVVIYRVRTSDEQAARRCLSALKERLKEEFQQEGILIGAGGRRTTGSGRLSTVPRLHDAPVPATLPAEGLGDRQPTAGRLLRSGPHATLRAPGALRLHPQTRRRHVKARRARRPPQGSARPLLARSAAALAQRSPGSLRPG